jgi:hypothetical protein
MAADSLFCQIGDLFFYYSFMALLSLDQRKDHILEIGMLCQHTLVHFDRSLFFPQGYPKHFDICHNSSSFKGFEWNKDRRLLSLHARSGDTKFLWGHAENIHPGYQTLTPWTFAHGVIA